MVGRFDSCFIYVFDLSLVKFKSILCVCRIHEFFSRRFVRHFCSETNLFLLSNYYIQKTNTYRNIIDSTMDNNILFLAIFSQRIKYHPIRADTDSLYQNTLRKIN